MQLTAFLLLLAAVLYTASASPFPAPVVLDFLKLPNCAQTCKDLRVTDRVCTPLVAPITNEATYLACFCGNQNLRSLYNVKGLCGPCGQEASEMIMSHVGTICGFPPLDANTFITASATSKPIPSTKTSATSTGVSLIKSLTPSPLSSPPASIKPTSSPQATSTESTSTTEPTSTNTLNPGVSHTAQFQSHSWIHDHWKTLVAIVSVLVVVLPVVGWLIYVRIHNWLIGRRDARRRTRTLEEHFQDVWAEEHGPAARGRIIPLKTIRADRSIRGRLSRIPIIDPIVNRRQRQRDLSVNTLTPLAHLLLPSASETWTPQRPASARTVASSIGQRSVSSPLDSRSPRMPRSRALPIDPRRLCKTSHGESLRHYAAEQAEQKRNLELLKSMSAGNLQRANGHSDGW